MKYLEYLKNVLSAGGLHVDPEDEYGCILTEEDKVWVVDGHEVFLPKQETLKHAGKLNKERNKCIYYFHPLGEDALYSESPVFKSFKHRVTLTLTSQQLKAVAGVALIINEDSPISMAEYHKAMEEEFGHCVNFEELWKDLQHFSAKGLDFIMNAFAKAFNNKLTFRASIRAGKLGNKTYPKVCYLRNKGIESILDENAKKASWKTQGKAVRALFTFALGAEEAHKAKGEEEQVKLVLDASKFSRGSDSSVSPRYCSLMDAYQAALSAMTPLYTTTPERYDEQFGDLIEHLEAVRTPVKELTGLNLIPRGLAGTIGTTSLKSEEDVDESKAKEVTSPKATTSPKAAPAAKEAETVNREGRVDIFAALGGGVNPMEGVEKKPQPDTSWITPAQPEQNKWLNSQPASGGSSWVQQSNPQGNAWVDDSQEAQRRAEEERWLASQGFGETQIQSGGGWSQPSGGGWSQPSGNGNRWIR